MKATLDTEDIESIANSLLEKLKPILSQRKDSEDDNIFTPETLAEYLKVDISWVYKQVSLKTIPYFKSGKYVRFRKSHIDRWIETQSVKPFSHLRAVKTG